MLLERETLPPVQGRDESAAAKIDDECDLAVIAFLQGERKQRIRSGNDRFLCLGVFQCLV